MVNYLYEFDTETLLPQPGVLIADHFIRSHGYCGHRASGTKDWLMIYTLSGEGHFLVHRQVQRCQPGDIILLPPGTPHHYATPENSVWELMWVHFVPVPEWQAWLQLPRTEENLIYMAMEDENTRTRIKGAFTRLIHDCLSPAEVDRQLAFICLSEILALLHREVSRSSLSNLDRRIELILRHLTEHLHEPQSISDLARLADLSVSRLCHLFKQEVGESIIDKLNRMRLEKASKLLELTPRKIQDIAMEVGFDSAYYFTRRFKQLFGLCPADFRKQVKNKWLYQTTEPRS